MPSSPAPPIRAEDLYRIEQITGLHISPDGRHVIYSQQWVDRKTEKKYSNLWLVPTDGGAPRRFTYGDQVDSAPRFAPNGRTIAFLSNRGDEKQPQIYLIPFDGGEARPLTSLQGDFAGFEWSPNSRHLVTAFRKKDPEEIARQKGERKKELGVVERHVTRLFYKLDGVGFLPHERRHIWVVDVPSGRARQLTESEVYDDRDPTWSPDGRVIAFLSNREVPDPDLEPDAVDLYIIPASGGEPRRIPTPYGPKFTPRFSPTGRWIAYFGREGRGNWWKNTHLWIVPADGSAPARDLLKGHDLHVDCWTINDLAGALTLTPPTWSADGQSIYFQTVEHGRTQLRRVTLDGEVEMVIDEPGVVGAYSLDERQRRLACFFATMTDPGQVCVREMLSGRLHPLTRVNERLLRRRDLGTFEEVWFEGPDGNRLQGWILKPPGFTRRRRYPLILEIHGGPLVQYGHLFMHEFYYLAAQGYLVAFCNPRGGRGYGEAHAKAIWGDWGGQDYADLMAWTDYLAALPYVDEKRMGVTGGSYGGYMTLWIIGHTDRFRAAVAQRVVSNFISMWGTSDFNWVFQEPLRGKPPWEDLKTFWKHSPVAYLHRARTPTLIIHSEHDHRTPIEQGEQAFVTLRKAGVETEMVRFPDEPHGLSRVGRTDRRIARLKHILRWFDRYLSRR